MFFAKSVKAQHNSEISFTTLELTLLKYQINFEKIKSKIQFQNLQYSFKDQAKDSTPYSGFNSYWFHPQIRTWSHHRYSFNQVRILEANIGCICNNDKR